MPTSCGRSWKYDGFAACGFAPGAKPQAANLTEGGSSVKMFISRVVLAGAFLSVLPLRAPAQDRVDEYRRLFKKPTNATQFWDAMKFEMDLGRFDLASQLLSEMLKKAPTEQELIDLHDKEGIAPFLR